MLDIFDILGPVMVGPSSSHTAGAVRIGRMARACLEGRSVVPLRTSALHRVPLGCASRQRAV